MGRSGIRRYAVPVQRGLWHAPQGRVAGLLFAGAGDLLGLLDHLVRRPWRWGRETTPPIIVLHRQPGTSTPFDGIAARLDAARGGAIVYARCDPTPVDQEPTLAALNALLGRIVADLAGSFGRTRRIRFCHYSLGCWLLSLEVSPETPADQQEKVIAAQLRDHLASRTPTWATARQFGDLAADFPWWVRFCVALLPRLGLSMLRAFGAPPRWYARHRLARGAGHSFYRLARMFARDGLREQQPQAVAALLVDAFLQDLRRAYRRTSLQGVGRRRTSYPVLLLDADPPVAAWLLSLVRSSRQQGHATIERRPADDPLLVVATTTVANDRAPSVEETIPAYLDWAAQRAHAPGTSSPDLPLTVPPPPAPPGVLADVMASGVPSVRRPWMSILAVGLLLLVGVEIPLQNRMRCDQLYSLSAYTARSRTTMGSSDADCMGVGTGGYRFFDALPPTVASRDQLRQLEATIAATNAEVVSDPGYVTVVYLSMLTGTDDDDTRSMVEELRAIAIAQAERRSHVPVRVLLANAGAGMDHGRTAAQLIADAANRERIVAVMGVGVSRVGTAEALDVLRDANIPTVGTLLSQDSFADRYGPYLQVGPSNQRQAAVLASYVKTLRPAITRVRIDSSGDSHDTYAANLADDVATALRRNGVTVTTRLYQVGTDDTLRTTDYRGAGPAQRGSEACESSGADQAVFFAGRAADFPIYLDGMRDRCRDGRYPRLLAGDSITRFVLGGKLNQYPGLSLDYLAMATSLTWRQGCGPANDPHAFLEEYRTFVDGGGLPGSATARPPAASGAGCDQSRDGQAMLAYDAFNLIRAGVVQANADATRVAETRVELVDIMRHLGQISPTQSAGFAGITGQITFGAGASPEQKAVLVLRINAGSDPRVAMQCGQIGRQPTSTGCPDAGSPPDIAARPTSGAH